MSRGTDKTLAEVKLSSNNQYLHGYQEQVIEYGSAERTRSLIYVFIDVGNPGRLRTIKAIHQKNKIEGKACPELVVIDARQKNAASTYFAEEDLKEYAFDFGDLPAIDLSDVECVDLQVPEFDLGEINI